tara:strand:- start:5608 stop:6570 length:963 start_codon:yes stop_codon:yes gene_type:complete
MTRQDISIGSSANDGTGDTLRSAGNKINLNFKELYTQFGGDSSTLTTKVIIKDSGSEGTIIFEGTSADDHETKLIATDPTADRTITLPDAGGNVVIDTATQTLTNKTLTTPTIASITNGGTITIPSGAGTITTIAASQTLTNKTLTAPIINSPTIGTLINDANGNEIIKLTATGSAVNELTIANGASTTGPALSATGTGSNLNLSLTAKGKGSVSLNKAAFSSDEFDSNGHNGGHADSGSSLIICNSGTPLAVALGPGTTTGEFKIFTNKGSGMATITPTSFANGTSIQLPTNRATQCIWDGAKWFMLTARDSSNSIIVI